MKKRLVLLFVLVLTILSVSSCGSKSKSIIAVCLGDLDDPFMLQMQDAFTTEFGEEYDVQVASAENDPTTQATQIDGFTAAGAKFMFVIPVDPAAVDSNLRAARKAGTLVLVAGGDPGENSRDAILKMDQYLTGEYVTILAKEWTAKTYPDAEVNSIQTVILSSNQTSESTSRSTGMTLIAKDYLVNEKGQYIDSQGSAISDSEGNYFSGKAGPDRVVNPYHSAKVRIMTIAEATTYEAGLQAMRNILIAYPDVKLVMAHSSEVAEGASAAIMEANTNASDGNTIDPKGIAVFGVGLFGMVEEPIINASMNRGVYRGAVAYGGADFPSTIIAMAKLMLENKTYPPVTWQELVLVTAEDGQLSIAPVKNTGFILVK
jgi:ABC-type sugar transport system substrate-binding protein